MSHRELAQSNEKNNKDAEWVNAQYPPDEKRTIDSVSRQSALLPFKREHQH